MSQFGCMLATGKHLAHAEFSRHCLADVSALLVADYLECRDHRKLRAFIWCLVQCRIVRVDRVERVQNHPAHGAAARKAGLA
jgi:hypothetical protein